MTGSRAYERFTGPQIKHLYKNQPDLYSQTERISLISSFLASLFLGKYAPIDLSDGSGMNLLNISTLKWENSLLEFVAPDLREKLGDEFVPSYEKLGLISDYWCKKYGFSKECEIYAFSGDNPCSLVGLGLSEPGQIGISLGTSDVLFAVTDSPRPNELEGSILIHPEDEKNYMIMLVYKNGSNTREFVRNQLKNKDWFGFNECIRSTPVGNEGIIGFYFLETEITPNIRGKGVVRFDLNDQIISKDFFDFSDCRAVIESQCLSYRFHAHKLGLKNIKSIVVTGGGSINVEILQILADVFQIEVRASKVVNTAASGAALRAMNAFNNNRGLPRKEDNKPGDLSGICVKPNRNNSLIYEEMYSRFVKLEQKVCEFLNN